MKNLVGTLFTDHVQPYGTRTIRIEEVEYDGTPRPDYATMFSIGPHCIMRLHGTVVEGRETSFLFGHRLTKDITGRSHSVYGVTLEHIEKGEKISVAM